ncbi:MAG TPA: 16S rRNA (cytosine(1402)-N(4))-methyltransferase RsmH [Nitrospiraceae bacterium]|nr:16S rRNA (cytosine(1402)-N(4))-methyltransferase RsmH [Nitrospiraceae bacterium]
MEVSRHIPVMSEEVLFWLIRGDGRTYLDCTVGYSGHAEKLLEAGGPDSRLIGFDCDAVAIAASREKLARFGDRVLLLQGHFMNLKQHLAASDIGQVDGILFDLGVSSPQLDEPARGFSFQGDGPLDMRMDQSMSGTAADLVNRWPEAQLADAIFQFGEERFSRRIARAIVRARERHPLATTKDLVSVIEAAVPANYRHGRLHCATRTFQAVRIAVNQELDCLEPALRDAVDVLSPGGRLCVISFHSLEDRIVKHTFRALSGKDDPALLVLTKKPQVPSREESDRNPRSRSAKLRVAQRVSREGHS